MKMIVRTAKVSAVFSLCFLFLGLLVFPLSAQAQVFYICGDGYCSYPGENSFNCPWDCSGGGGDCQSLCNCPGPGIVCPTVCVPLICGDGQCVTGENDWSCPQDCHPLRCCGDRVCGYDENLSNCLQDCDSCGNHICGPSESASSCYQDCGSCGDGVCTSPQEGYGTCDADCGFCGDGICMIPQEDLTTCAADCQAVWDADGDGLTDVLETSTYHTNPQDVDTDDGGEQDGAEVQHGRDPLAPGDDYFGPLVNIGTGNGTWGVPFDLYSVVSRSQVIYLASEIGSAGTIISLALNVTNPPPQDMNNFTIRLKHTPLSSYSIAAWETGWTVVYQNNEPPGGVGWRTFVFTTPFVYNGMDNLSVDFSLNNTISYSYSGYCLRSIPGGYRTLTYHTSHGYGDPLAWSGTSNPTPNLRTDVPNLQLGFLGQAYPPDADADGLSNDFEAFLGTDANRADTDGDALTDFEEVIGYGTSPVSWDTDGDALPDAYEVADGALNALDPTDAALSFDGDANSNVNEYWNGSDPWATEPVGGAGCFYWGDSGRGDGIVSPADLNEIKKVVSGTRGNYAGVFPNNGETQDLDADGFVSPNDVSILRKMIVQAATPILGSRPVALEILESPPPTVAVGMTCHLAVGVKNAAGSYTPGFGVVFELVTGQSAGTATLLGGEGADRGAADPSRARYDVSGSIADSGRSRIVLRIDSAGVITIRARIPACGKPGLGRSSPEIVLDPAAVIQAQ